LAVRKPSGASPRGRDDARALVQTKFSLRYAAVIAAVALVACIAGAANGFTQDDVVLLVETTRLRDIANWSEILTRPYWPPPLAADLYRPLTSLALAAQNTIGGGSPLIFRIVSYALYAICCVAFFRFARRQLAPRTAFFVALLFAAHPVHVETITLAVAQPEIVVSILVLVAGGLYYRVRRSGEGRITLRTGAAIAACYTAASLSKEQGFTLPAFLLLIEVFLVAGPVAATRVRVLAPLYGTLAAVGGALFALRTSILSGAVSASHVADALRGLDIGGRALTMLQVVPEWTRLLLWPSHLRAEYSPAEFVASNGFGGAEAIGLAIVIASLLLVWFARRRAPVAAFGMAWCWVALFPVSNVVVPTGILIAERTLFLPSIGALLTLGGLAQFFSARIRRPFVVRAVAVAATLLVIAGLARSMNRQRIWRNPERLTIASLEDSPGSWKVQWAWGAILYNQHRVEEGNSAYKRAIATAPDPWRPRNDLALRMRSVGNDDGAVEQLRLSISENPQQVEPYVGLPLALIALGRYSEAGKMVDSIIVAEGAPPAMVFLRRLVDSAVVNRIPAGTIRLLPPSAAHLSDLR
jgi:hypothetical protein